MKIAKTAKKIAKTQSVRNNKVGLICKKDDSCSTEKNYTKTVVKGTALIFAASLIGAILAYLLRFKLAHSLTKFEYGLFYAVIALIGILNIFKDLGLSSSLVKFIPEFKVHKKFKEINALLTSVFSIQFIVSALIALCLFLASDYLAANYFKAPGYGFLIKVMAVVFFVSFSTDNFLAQVFFGMQKISNYFLLDVMRNILFYFITLFFLSYKVNVYAPAYSYLISYLLLSIVFSIIFLKDFLRALIRFRMRFDPVLLKKIFAFSVPMALSMAGMVMIGYIDTLSITYFRNLEEVAIYQAAFPIFMIILYFSSAISGAIFPVTSELLARKKKESISFAIRALQVYSFVVIIPFALIMFLFPDTIIRMFFGEGYIAAAPVLKVLSIGAVAYTVFFINYVITAGLGKPMLNTRIMIFAALINLLLNVLLVPGYGPVGAAIATTLTYILLLVLSSFNLRSVMKVKIPFFEWSKIFLSAAVFVVIVAFLKDYLVLNPWLEMAISLGAAFAVYALLILLLRVVRMDDVKGILNQLSK